MRSDEQPGGATEGGRHGSQTVPPMSPPMAGAPRTTNARALLIGAGFATLGALLAFLTGCLGEGSELAVELGLLLAVLAVVLDALAGKILGGIGGGGTVPPVSPPEPIAKSALTYLTTATILTALGLLSVMLQCALEAGHGSAKAGLLLLLLAAVADFTAAYKAK